jgi:hypothetical protein
VCVRERVCEGSSEWADAIWRVPTHPLMQCSKVSDVGTTMLEERRESHFLWKGVDTCTTHERCSGIHTATLRGTLYSK